MPLRMAVSAKLLRFQPCAIVFAPTPRQGFASPGCIKPQPALTRLRGAVFVAPPKHFSGPKKERRQISSDFDSHSHCPIDHWTSHDLRRTTRTGLARLGCPYEIGESILGHRLPGVAGVYNVYADEMRNWLDRWAEHVAGIAAPRAKPVRARPRQRE